MVFSSREVFTLPGNVTVLTVRIPIAKGLSVTLQDGKVVLVDFLPPVQLRLIPTPDSPDYKHEAHVSCSWMSFRQLRKTSAILDDLWDPEIEFTCNLENVLQKLGLDLGTKLIKLNHLDLTWRAKSANPAKSDSLQLEVPVQLKRRSAASRQPKFLNVKTVSYHKKSFDLQDLLKKYDEDEKRVGSIPGVDMVFCPVRTSCEGVVLPTRASSSTRCEKMHPICYKCTMDLIESSNSFPYCVEYQCYTHYTKFDLLPFVTGIPDLVDKIEGWGILRIESRTVREFCMHRCPWCGAKVFPQFYVNQYKITLCRICHKCSCNKCMLYYDGKDTPDNLLCDVMKGQKLYELSHTDSFLEELDKYSNQYLLEIKDAWEYQNRKVHDEQCCPNCFTSYNKLEGCDHVTCKSCDTHFCYHCGELISTKRPYDHFDEGKCTNHFYYL